MRRKDRVIAAPWFPAAGRRALLGAVIAACATAGLVDAQGQSGTRIRVRAASGSPIVGALVGLINTENKVVAEGLSTADGGRSLTVPPGTYRVQVRRIGFEPFISEPMSFPRAEDIVLSITDRAVSLQTVVVSANARCESIERDAAALSKVWQEIAKALRSSQLTTEDLAGIGQAHLYTRSIGSRGQVTSNQTRVFKVVNARPFGAIDPRLLASVGYVNGNATDGWQYFSPDETVFLSDSFAATHCFRVVRDKSRRGQIGVSFEPVSGRKQADVAGVLWVEEKTAELREMRFKFVNVEIISNFDAGGRTRFRRMPSGAWLVDEWSLRFPLLERRVGRDEFFEIGFIENGGGIIQDTVVTR